MEGLFDSTGISSETKRLDNNQPLPDPVTDDSLEYLQRLARLDYQLRVTELGIRRDERMKAIALTEDHVGGPMIPSEDRTSPATS